MRLLSLLLLLAAPVLGKEAFSTNANRLTYLTESDPFYVGLHFPKLTTAQWVGEPGVETVVTLGIDDMRAHQKYEEFLRPILERLKQIDGRAPVSIFSNALNPEEPHFAKWLQEGLSLEVHTLSHPCPILAKSNFVAAVETYHGCVDLLHRVPGNKPVAFRTPCCDSINSASPRLFAELLGGVSPQKNFLTMDSSVVLLLTTNDPALPAAEMTDAKARPRFLKYVPFPSFKTTIENYPYPYLITGKIWEMPFVAPSDWESFNIQGNVSPQLLEDWKKALDLTALKGGTLNLVLHPHGWSSSQQFVDLIDHAISAHGKKVKFLTFREADERLTKNLLLGQPTRAANGGDNGVRMIDLNNDGFLDVVIGNNTHRRTRVWQPEAKAWRDSEFPLGLVGTHAQFGIVRNGAVSVIVAEEGRRGAWTFDGAAWKEDARLLEGLQKVEFAARGLDNGARFRDVDRDGVCELIVSNAKENLLFRWDEKEKRWAPGDFRLPEGVSIVNAAGQDNGVRFVDVNEDGYDDVLFSNEHRYGFWLFLREMHLGFGKGWTRKVSEGARGDANAIPAFVRAGENRHNGAWFHSKALWVQNEDTAHLPDLVERRSFKELLIGDAPEAKSPEESRAMIKVSGDFEVELVAAEPLVDDPVAFEWDAQGRLWVVEMRDYPLGIDGNGKPGGVVKILSDTDKDGKYDKADEFLNDLNFPNGLLPWGKGVLISATPDIIYAEDTNGDGVADSRRTMVRGFAEGNQQHRMNGFEIGLDGWIYGANGDSGGTVQVVGIVGGKVEAGPRVNIGAGDFRFKPNSGEFEVIEGTTQYGRRRDDWNNWFGNNNSFWLWHYFLPQRYVERNPHLRAGSLKFMTPQREDGRRLFPAGRLQQRFNDVGLEGNASAACSATPYRDDLFGAKFEDSVFIADPSYGMIHREVLKPQGATFTSHRAPEEADTEFLVSTDPWFRPITVKTGPDGALYFADMYRFIIEHPEWIPEDVKKELDLRAGTGMGRIYRVVPKGTKLAPIPNLAAMENDALARALESPNGWQRDTAQILLVERNATKVTEPLLMLAQKSSRPKVRAQALWTLASLKTLKPEDVIAGMRDSDARVRRGALRIAETFAPMSAELQRAVILAANDPDAQVAFQTALALGYIEDAEGAKALAAIHKRFEQDEHFHTAVMSSAPKHVRGLLKERPLPRGIIQLATALKLDSEVAEALSEIATGGVNEAWKFRAAGEATVIPAAFTEAAAAATRAGEEAAIPLVNDPALLAELVRNGPAKIQSAALAQLTKLGTPAAADALIALWPSAGPELRARLLSSLLSRGPWVERLLRALEQKQIEPYALAADQRQRLIDHRDATIRDRAKNLLAIDKSRAEALAAFATVGDLPGDVARGAKVFATACALCHEGGKVGPELASVASKPLDYLLTAIVDPNQAVEARYTSYIATTKDRREISGLIVAENANSVTFAQPGGEQTTLLRAEIKDLRASGKSLMPEGLEASLKPQDMADLISFLRAR